MGTQKHKIDFVLFVKVWQAAATVLDVITGLGLSDEPNLRQSITNTASRLRKRGVPLKSLTRSVIPAKLTVDEFVAKWNAARSLSAFVAETGYAESSASTRASVLRKKGHDLKPFPKRLPGGVSYEELAAIAAASV